MRERVTEGKTVGMGSTHQAVVVIRLAELQMPQDGENRVAEDLCGPQVGVCSKSEGQTQEWAELACQPREHHLERYQRIAQEREQVPRDGAGWRKVQCEVRYVVPVETHLKSLRAIFDPSHVQREHV